MVQRVVEVLRPVLVAVKPREPPAMDTGREENSGAGDDARDRASYSAISRGHSICALYVQRFQLEAHRNTRFVTFGFGVIAVMRFRGWQRIRVALRSSTPIEIAATKIGRAHV